MNRAEMVAKNNLKYIERFDYFDDGTPMCAYCGTVATDEEHVYPLTSIDRLGDVDVIKKSALVFSCRECNAVANSKVFKTLNHKLFFIKEQLYKRHKHLLRLAVWKDDELDELGYSLRTYVEQSEHNRRLFVERINWQRSKMENLFKNKAIAFYRKFDNLANRGIYT